MGNNVCFYLYYQPKDDDKSIGLDTIIIFCGTFALHFLQRLRASVTSRCTQEVLVDGRI